MAEYSPSKPGFDVPFDQDYSPTHVDVYSPQSPVERKNTFFPEWFTKSFKQQSAKQTYNPVSPPYVATSPVYVVNSPVYAVTSPVYRSSESTLEKAPANTADFYLERTEAQRPPAKFDWPEEQEKERERESAKKEEEEETESETREWRCEIVSWLAILNGFFTNVRNEQPPVVGKFLCVDLSLLPLLPRFFASESLVDAVMRVLAGAKSELPRNAPVNLMEVTFDAEVGFLVRRPAAGLCVPFKARLDGGAVWLRHCAVSQMQRWDFWKSANYYVRQLRVALSAADLKPMDLPTLTRCAFSKNVEELEAWPMGARLVSGGGAGNRNVGPCTHKLVDMSGDPHVFLRALKAYRRGLDALHLTCERALQNFEAAATSLEELTQTRLLLFLSGDRHDLLKPWVPVDMQALERWELQQVQTFFGEPLKCKRKKRGGGKNSSVRKKPYSRPPGAREREKEKEKDDKRRDSRKEPRRDSRQRSRHESRRDSRKDGDRLHRR